MHADVSWLKYSTKLEAQSALATHITVLQIVGNVNTKCTLNWSVFFIFELFCFVSTYPTPEPKSNKWPGEKSGSLNFILWYTKKSQLTKRIFFRVLNSENNYVFFYFAKYLLYGCVLGRKPGNKIKNALFSVVTLKKQKQKHFQQKNQTDIKFLVISIKA